MLCVITIVGYKSYGHTIISRVEFMVANIESIATPETGIKLEYCFILAIKLSLRVLKIVYTTNYYSIIYK